MMILFAYIQKDVELQHLYLGRSPPTFTEMRVLRHSNGDDHLVSEANCSTQTGWVYCIDSYAPGNVVFMLIFCRFWNWE